MHLRRRAVLGALIPVVLVLVAACGSGSATKAPAAPTPAPAAATPAATTPAATIPAAAASAPGGVPAGGPEADEMVTAEMAASIIGGSPTKMSIPGAAGAPGVMSLAAYSNTDGDNVTVLVQRIPGGFAAGMLQIAIQAAGANGELKPLSGLGDSAGQVTNEHDATVAFAKGNTLVVIQASDSASSGADIEAKLEALAREIIGKL